MKLSPNTPEAMDPTLQTLRSMVTRGRHMEADRYAQAHGRRVPVEVRKMFFALRAEVAIGLGKFTSALEWASEALKGLDPNHRLVCSTQGSRIRALLGLGRFREASATIERLSASPNRHVSLSFYRGHVHMHSGRLTDAVDAASEACVRSIEANDRARYVEALQLRSRIHRETGDVASARTDLDRAHRASNGLRDAGALAGVLSDRADLMAHTGNWAEAARDASQSGRIFARAFSPHEHLSAGRRTGLLSLAQGEPNAALPAIEKAADVARRGFGTSECRAEIDLLLADAQLADRDSEGALERASAALSFFRDAQDPGGLARAHVRRSLAALSAANVPLALREARIAGSIPGAGPVAEGLADLALGRILLRRERARAAVAFDRASRNKSLYPPLVSVAHLGHALAAGASLQSDAIRQNLAEIQRFGDRRILSLVRSDLRDLYGVEVLQERADLRAYVPDALGLNGPDFDTDEAIDGEEFLPGLIGSSEAVRRLADIVTRIAPDDVPVSIFGETGTGKENVARALHVLSERASKRFMAVNAAALSDELFESTLFGHIRGSFTGAHADQAGLVEDANGGTLFLDEIADLSPRNQVKLLRFLQDGTYRKVGESRERKSNVRVVVAANQKLEDLVRAGGFRADLRFRLQGVAINVPPLRDRGRDVIRLARHFVARFSRNTKRLSETAETEIRAHAWPGNVRELEQEVRQATALAKSAVVEWARPKPETSAPSVPVTEANPAAPLHEAMGGFERTFLKSVLTRCTERTEAARMLGISRQALHQKILRFGL